MKPHIGVFSMFWVIWWGCAVPVWAEHDRVLGTVDGQVVRIEDMVLKDYLVWYKHAKAVYELEKELFKHYAYINILTRLAKEQNVTLDAYLQKNVYSSIPAVSPKEIEDFLRTHERALQDQDAESPQVQAQVKQQILDEKKKAKEREFKEKVLAEADLRFTVPPIKTPKIEIRLQDNETIYGSSNARIDIVAFIDLECPYCKNMYPKLTALQHSRPDDIRLIFKHFPLPIHAKAIPLAYEAHCADQQGAFLAYVELLHEMGDCDSCREDIIERLGIDADAFRSCLSDPQTASKIAGDVNVGTQMGITNLPTILINGIPVIGDVSVDELEQIVREQASLTSN